MARWAVLLAALVLVGAASGKTGSPPGPGTLVFFSQRTTDGGLYAEDARAGRLRLLVTRSSDSGIVWSRDGRRFAFQRPGTPVWESELWVFDANGSRKRRIARNAGQPSWSPDGHRLAVVRKDALWILQADGSQMRALTTPGGLRDSTPRWSPDGRLIAFLRTPGGTQSTLMAVGPNGKNLRRISERVFFPPTWSPDAKRIAFDSSGPTDVGQYVPRAYVADADGRHRRRLGNSSVNGYVVWSPNGRWIAFGGGGTGAVSIIHPDGTGQRRLLGSDLASVPAWAPNSQRLAVAVGQPADVWIVDVSGRTRRVTQGWRYGYSNYNPAWQPEHPPPSRLGGTVVSPKIPTDSVVVGGVLQTSQPVDALVADGGRVAVAYPPGAPGGRCIETWSPASGSIVRFNECGFQRPALAGALVALPVFEHALGTNAYGIRTATVDRPNPQWVTGLCAPARFPFCIRDPVGDLVGGGSLVVFDSWKGPEPYCNLPCPPPKREGRLYRIDNGTAVQIASSSTELTPLAVDNGRILVDEGSGTLAILDTTGTQILKIADPGFTEGSLQGPDLVSHNGTALHDYDSTSGALLHMWPIPAAATLTGVQGGLAAYVTGTGVHVLRLADGHDVVIGPTGAGPYQASLSSAGLFYSYAAVGTTRPGRIAFVPSH